MNKLNFIIPALLFVFTFGSAFTSFQDAKADKILKDSKATFQSLSDFSADFVYSIRNNALADSRSIVKKGKIKLKGNKFFVVLDEQEIYCDGETQWIHHKTDKEVNIFPYDPEESLNIASIFEVYEANGKSRYEGVEKVDASNCDKIFLSIVDKTMDYNRATLWINQKTKLPAKALLLDRNQTATEIKFSNVKVNQKYPDSDFAFDINKYQNVEVYDER